MDLICQMRYGLQYHITLDAKSNSADTVKKNPGKNVLSQMIKTVSIRKLNDFNFQWTKLFFQNISSHIAFLFTLFKGYRCTVIRVNPLLSPPGGVFFSSTFQEGFIERGAYSIWRNASAGARFLDDGLVVPGRYTAFSNNKKMAAIERKAHEAGGHVAEDQTQYELPA